MSSRQSDLPRQLNQGAQVLLTRELNWKIMILI